MAFENFPSAESRPPVTPQPKRSDWRTFLTVILVIALLGTWGYIIWDKSQTKETLVQKDTQYAVVITEKDTLQSLLDEATMRYDLLKTTNAKKDSTITKKDREIAEKKAKIQSILSNVNASKAQLAEAKRLIATLNTDIQGYKDQIESLKGQNLQLTKEKQAVTEEKIVVEKNLDSAKTVIKAKEDLIDVGSTLHASNFNIAGVQEKKSGKEKETTTAKKVDKLRITFDLDENRIAQSGAKELYVSITAPDGTPVAVEALGSGKFSTRDGEDKFFTHKVEINYTQGQKQTVSFDWKQNANFAIGSYKIEVFHNGFKIGEGVKIFKKGGLFG
ncbi:MAG: hypothetical protein ABIS01_04785 [Ferruginibacter sp.]